MTITHPSIDKNLGLASVTDKELPPVPKARQERRR